MSRVPTAEIVVDGRSLSIPESGLIAMSVSIGSGPSVDAATLALSWYSPVAATEPGAPVEVSLGYEGENELVLTGDVQRATGAPWGVRLDVHAEPGRLQRVRVGQSFLDQTAADIISTLAGEADVRTGELASGDPLAAYHVDEHRTAWRHANDLARLVGGQLTTEPDGALSMLVAGGGGALGGLADAAASAAGSLLGGAGGYRYGAELLDVAIVRSMAEPTPQVVPHGAASPLGGDKWHLLLREPDGGAPGEPTLVPAAIRDQSGADTFRGGIEVLASRAAATGRLAVRGVASLRVGDSIEVGDWPHGEPPAFRVADVQHRMSRADGFASHVRLEQAA
ncbi:MAG: hypothetical protein QNJ12_07200 [Ilumatobacter sp.]|uniref:hypothetical protein n=1 Tax=Ilumatobacter sp. TaxID=1967498 RepID=UPI0026092486|nr:hypothetical protein [Ilumatobacter sp.]MDJ0768564.1 hypothetical protein [Ilumatobacter sp.]